MIFLKKGDENLQKVQTAEYFSYKGFHSNLALTYYKRYEICMKYESESESESESNDNESEIETQIQIDKWTATTIDGKNENELKTSLKNYINKKNIPYINSEKFFNFKMMVAIIIAIVACFLLRSLPQFIILFIV